MRVYYACRHLQLMLAANIFVISVSLDIWLEKFTNDIISQPHHRTLMQTNFVIMNMLKMALTSCAHS